MRQRRLPVGARQDEGQPREDEDDVGTEEVGRGLPAGREEEHEIECEAHRRRGPGEEPGQDQQAHRDLEQRDADAGQLGVGYREGVEEEAPGRPVREAVQLCADIGGGARVEEAGIAQLLDPRVDERDAEEDPEREQRHRRPRPKCTHALGRGRNHARTIDCAGYADLRRG